MQNLVPEVTLTDKILTFW